MPNSSENKTALRVTNIAKLYWKKAKLDDWLYLMIKHQRFTSLTSENKNCYI